MTATELKPYRPRTTELRFEEKLRVLGASVFRSSSKRNCKRAPRSQAGQKQGFKTWPINEVTPSRCLTVVDSSLTSIDWLAADRFAGA